MGSQNAETRSAVDKKTGRPPRAYPRKAGRPVIVLQ